MKLTILVVNSEEKVRDIYMSLLDELGYEVMTATNRKEADNLISQEKIDLVLMDIQLRGQGDEHIFNRLREHATEIKIIVYSVDEQEEDTETTDEYLKSDRVDMLLDKIKRNFMSN